MKILCLILFVFLCSCSDDDSVVSGWEPNIKYKSPVPMKNHARPMEVTSYDSYGETVLSVDTVTLKVEKTWNSSNNNYDGIDSLFTFQWENNDTGWIIAYRQPDESDLGGGVVVVGEFDYSGTTYYEKELMWLPYPAESGSAGDSFIDSAKADSSDIDSSITVLHELDVSIVNIVGLPVTTHCYRVGPEGDCTYSYYEIDSGLVAMLVYRNGKRVRSFTKI